MPNPGNATYTGNPSPEVDAAWEELVGGMCQLLPILIVTLLTLSREIERDFLITEEEAKALWPSDYQMHWDNRHGGYWVGLEMFHALHCVVGNHFNIYNPLLTSASRQLSTSISTLSTMGLS
jgi:hypothetical protein